MWHLPQGRCHSYIRLAVSDIASQLYLGYAQVIFASRVFGANIISLKLQVSISLCVITQNITVRPVSQYHLTFLFLSKKTKGDNFFTKCLHFLVIYFQWKCDILRYNRKVIYAAGKFVLLIIGLVNTLLHHCLCNLFKACDVCTGNKIIAQIVFFSRLNRVLMYINHSLMKSLVNLLGSP